MPTDEWTVAMKKSFEHDSKVVSGVARNKLSIDFVPAISSYVGGIF